MERKKNITTHKSRFIKAMQINLFTPAVRFLFYLRVYLFFNTIRTKNNFFF
jgi:hypothetical protein